MLNLLAKTVDVVSDSSWRDELIKEIFNLLSAPSVLSSDERRFLFKCYGVVLCIKNEDKILNKNISQILSVAKHELPEEVEGVSECIGILGVENVDLALSTISSIFYSLDSQLNQNFPRLSLFSTSVAGGSVFSKIFHNKDSSSSNSSSSDQIPSQIVFGNDGKIKELVCTLYWSISKIVHASGNIAASKISMQILPLFELFFKNQWFKESNINLSVIGCLSYLADALDRDPKKKTSLDLQSDAGIKIELCDIFVNYLKHTLSHELTSSIELVNFSPSILNRKTYEKSASPLLAEPLTRKDLLIIISSIALMRNILKIAPNSVQSMELSNALFSILSVVLKVSSSEITFDKILEESETTRDFSFAKLNLNPVSLSLTRDDDLDNSLLLRIITKSSICMAIERSDFQSGEPCLNLFIKSLLKSLDSPSSQIKLRSLILIKTILDAYCRPEAKYLKKFSIASQMLVSVLPLMSCDNPNFLRRYAVKVIKAMISLMDKTNQINEPPNGLLDVNLTVYCMPVDKFPKDWWTQTCVLVALIGRLNSQELDECIGLILDSLRKSQILLSQTSPNEEKLDFEDENDDFSEETNSIDVNSEATSDIVADILDVCELSFYGPRIPNNLNGLFIKVMMIISKFRGPNLDESKVEEILIFLHDIYPTTLCPGLRSGLLRIVVKLSYYFQGLCFDVLLKQELPFDLTWSIFLGAMAFYPSNSPWLSYYTQENKKVIHNMDLLMEKTLTILENCLPYEERDDPLNIKNRLKKADFKILKFATHIWLSSVNALQVLCYPLSLAELSSIDVQPNEQTRYHNLRSLFNTTSAHSKTIRRVKPTRTSSKSKDDSGSLTNKDDNPEVTASEMNFHYFNVFHEKNNLAKSLLRDDLYAKLLIHWSAICSISRELYVPRGLAFETRTGTEANLSKSFNPLRIAIDGFRNFLLATKSEKFLHTLGFSESVPCSGLEQKALSRKNKALNVIRELKKKKCDPASVLLEKNNETEISSLQNEDSFVDIFSNLAKLLKYQENKKLILIINSILVQIESGYEPIRKLAVIFLTNIPLGSLNNALHLNPKIVLFEDQATEIIQKKMSKAFIVEDQLRTLFKRLLDLINDDSPFIRHHSVIGIGNFSEHSLKLFRISLRDKPTNESRHEEVMISIIQKHTNDVIFAIMNQIESSNVLVTLSCLKALCSTLTCLTEENLRPNLMEIFTKLLLYFEAQSDEVRYESFKCYSWLCSFASKTVDSTLPARFTSTIPLVETESYQILKNQTKLAFIPTLLHICDTSVEVSDQCRLALMIMSPILFSSSMDFANSNIMQWHQMLGNDSSDLEDLFSLPNPDGDTITCFLRTSLISSVGRIHFGEFFSELAVLLTRNHISLAKSFVFQSLAYFKSEIVQIQTGAVLFTSHLLTHFSEEMKEHFQENIVKTELLKCLQSPYGSVRSAAAQGIAHLFKLSDTITKTE